MGGGGLPMAARRRFPPKARRWGAAPGAAAGVLPLSPGSPRGGVLPLSPGSPRGGVLPGGDAPQPRVGRPRAQGR